MLERVRAARVRLLERALPGWSPAELHAFGDQLHRLRSSLAAGDRRTAHGAADRATGRAADRATDRAADRAPALTAAQES